MASVGEILNALDRAAEAFVFPMLDNGYVYPAATRLGCFVGQAGWAIVLEVVGYSPRSGIPDVCVTTIGDGIHKTETAAKFVNEEAFANFCRVNPHWRQDFFFPFDDDNWIDYEEMESVRADIDNIRLRGEGVDVPTKQTLERIDKQGAIGEPSHVANVLRALAISDREALLATSQERRTRIPSEWQEMLTLDEWCHPDVVLEANKPSGSATFRSLAEVIVHRDPSRLASEEPNTHWTNWPDGGSL